MKNHSAWRRLLQVHHSALCTLHSALVRWLPDMDLNHDKQIQSLLCYRYTIGQTSVHSLRLRAPESRLVPNRF